MANQNKNMVHHPEGGSPGPFNHKTSNDLR
jgi:hypothetical protein